jgi:peroxin-4
LRKELNAAKASSDSDVVLTVDDSNIREWTALIRGPPDSPYVDYEFELKISVGADYPLTPPNIRMLTKCFHPNVHFNTGEICLDILKKNWSPAWSLQSACRAIVSLLGDPAPESPLNCDAGNMLRAGDQRAFESVAKLYCIEFANRASSSFE